MKKIIITIFLAFAVCFSFAQEKQPAEMRMEITEVSEDGNEYSVFTYKDKGGSTEYYMGLGRNCDICLFLGITADEAYESLSFLMDFFDNEAGTTVKFTCRLSVGAEKLGDYTSVSCMVVRHGMKGKHLNFKYECENHIIETEITQSAIKSLRSSFKAYRKMHKKLK